MKESRVVVDGKFLRLGDERFLAKGVTYGPFAPDQTGEFFGSPDQVERDLRLISELGANVLRVYHAPPIWFLNMLADHDLKAMVDIPWPKHLCVFESRSALREARDTVKEAIMQGECHPAIFAYSVANEIPSDIARYAGEKTVSGFVEDLIELGRSINPDSLFTYANYPPTQYLQPRNVDFVSFNVYLHRLKEFQDYLPHLQMLAHTKPLVLAELGMDTRRNDQAEVDEFLRSQIRHAFASGLAGTFVFSFSDDWYRGGQQVDDWAFGLTDRHRGKKPAYAVVQNEFRSAPRFGDVAWPRVSVVVASYNGGKTLRACLESLKDVQYPDYEVILVDDGSTDDTPSIAGDFPWVKTIRQENRGLSAARNAGIEAATGEVVAFTDSDCRVDADWLKYLVHDLVTSDFVGMGGHNFLPPDDSPKAAAVMAAPGGPIHVMLTDREAEHIPGCNMAFYREALREIGGFDPVFRKAGDDVDVCWRLQQRGHQLGFSSSGFVWHYRRSTVRAYLKQQAGYGEAEAILARRHPECFNRIGNGVWRGRIYQHDGGILNWQRSVIYHGVFGSGAFQKVYTSPHSSLLPIVTTLEYWVLLVFPTVVLSIWNPVVWLISLPLLLTPLVVAFRAGRAACIPKNRERIWSRMLVSILFLLQPIYRGFARYRMKSKLNPSGRTPVLLTEDLPLMDVREANARWVYWSNGWLDRFEFLKVLAKQAEQHGFHVRQDTGWYDYDLEIHGNIWSRFFLTTATEELADGKMNLLCKISLVWSPIAKLVLLGSLLVMIMLVLMLAPLQPWIWMLPIGWPPVLWFIESMHLQMASTIGSLVHQTAEDFELKLIRPDHEKSSAARSWKSKTTLPQGA